MSFEENQVNYLRIDTTFPQDDTQVYSILKQLKMFCKQEGINLNFEIIHQGIIIFTEAFDIKFYELLKSKLILFDYEDLKKKGQLPKYYNKIYNSNNDETFYCEYNDDSIYGSIELFKNMIVEEDLYKNVKESTI